MKSVGIVDLGVGNFRSVANMVRLVGGAPFSVRDERALQKADYLILPGVGAFDAGMSALVNAGLVSGLNDHKDKGNPILGICLGMQMLCGGSEEGGSEGLGWFDASCQRFSSSGAVPHMGWSEVCINRASRNSHKFSSINLSSRFYFVHSYHVVCSSENDVLMYSNYGERFSAAISKENVVGFQFHPEKSHRFGKALLTEFLDF